jgi:hypothetical protein
MQYGTSLGQWLLKQRAPCFLCINATLQICGIEQIAAATKASTPTINNQPSTPANTLIAIAPDGFDGLLYTCKHSRQVAKYSLKRLHTSGHVMYTGAILCMLISTVLC